MRFKGALLVLLLSLLGACTVQSRPPYPFAPKATNAAGRPAVIAPGSPQARPMPYCPPVLVAQGSRIMAQLARVRLGSSKMDVQSLLGSPLRAESFLLQDGGMAEVMYYPTPGSACGRMDAMLPMIFQNNRLIGYGPDYYQNFVVPTLKTPLSQMAVPPSYPQTVQPQPVQPNQNQGGSYPSRMVQEDLPTGPTSAPHRDYIPVNESAPAYQLSPQFQQQYPVQPTQPQPSVGRGEPILR